MELTFPYINQSLISGCINKNRNSQKRLYSLLSPYIFTAIIKAELDQKEVEEILQRVFIEIFSSIENYNRNVSFEHWCLEVYKNTIRLYHEGNSYRAQNSISRNALK